MEHSKFGAFMIQCNKCSRGWSLSEKDMKADIIICHDPECHSEFSIYEGIKNGLKKVEDDISPNFFLANEMYNLMIEVKVGYTTHVELPANVNKIYKVILFPLGPFLAGATDITRSGFNVFTSLPENDDDTMVGEQGKIKAIIHYKGEDYQVPWLHMLQYAFDELRSDEYLTSILLSEIALETYVNSMLTLGYYEIGLDKDSISRLLEAGRMHDKVNPLMYNLYGVKLQGSEVWGKWSKKILEWRNQIAHGSKVTATKEEAILAFESVVDSIFHFIEGVDNHRKKQGYPNGMFYRT
ncbi:hypothetical protein DFO70_12914 [Cytobacillus firmus]|uniref:Uncharacterized protein n=2 Tax=Cytobacillus TaxID=2675230 RepID=A0A366JIB4_CYTFI|nr:MULTISPECIES: hypothetical protein [Cytobacillus]RBP86235.1 hypothetical protein DFO70_12914 [Cytobacillus firmus]TDX35886.1 hypothetical protein DFO72_12514 [Cytobacillus oceanisediminis]